MTLHKQKTAVIIIAALLSLIMTAGCSHRTGDSSAGGYADCRITEVTIHEQGGEDGRNIDWKVYSENGRFYVSYLNNRISHGDTEPEVFEITAQEYDEVMSLDFEKQISEYDEEQEKMIVDNVYFQSVLKYDNGDERSTGANLTIAEIKLSELLKNYRGDDPFTGTVPVLD